MKYKKMKEKETIEKTVTKSEDNAGAFVDLLNQEMDNLIKSLKCGSCVHLQLCMAQKGGMNLGLASENNCYYYEQKLPKDSIVLTERELLDNCELNYDKGYKKGSKETAEKFYEFAKAWFEYDEQNDYFEEVKNLAKQFGVEIKE